MFTTSDLKARTNLIARFIRHNAASVKDILGHAYYIKMKQVNHTQHLGKSGNALCVIWMKCICSLTHIDSPKNTKTK